MLSAATYYLGNPIISDGASGLRNWRILSLTINAVLLPICVGIYGVLFIVEYALVFQTFCAEID